MTDADEHATSELSRWLAEGYTQAFRTACLILRNPGDAEDAVQDAFLRAWRFRTSLPKGEGARPWLYRVLVNACYSKQRSEGRHRLRSAGPDPLGTVQAAADPEAASHDAEMGRVVNAALGALPEHLRVAVVLRYYAGLSEIEIAAAIGKRPGTVKSRLHEARRRLAGDPLLRAWAEVP